MIQEEGCDAIYHTGDAIGIGPYPSGSSSARLSLAKSGPSEERDL